MSEVRVDGVPVGFDEERRMYIFPSGLRMSQKSIAEAGLPVVHVRRGVRAPGALSLVDTAGPGSLSEAEDDIDGGDHE